MIGQTLGHYRIDSKLGEGGMGVVYRAFDTHLDRAVAIKVLHPDATASPERKRRFVLEAKSASALNHPGIIHIYDINTANLPDGPIDFIAMEFVPGKTLGQCIGKNGLSLKDTLRYGIQIADDDALWQEALECGAFDLQRKPLKDNRRLAHAVSEAQALIASQALREFTSQAV